jgi:hypothetical protein
LAAFGFGGAALIAGRSFVAGLAFGLLALKPQLGIAIAVLLIACREWRTIAGIATSVALQAALSMAVVGLDPWLSYVAVIQRLPELRPYLEPSDKAVLQHSITGLVGLPSRVQPFVWLGASGVALYRTWRVWSGASSMRLKMGTLGIGVSAREPSFVYI